MAIQEQDSWFPPHDYVQARALAQFEREIRANGKTPAEILLDEEKQWAATHPEYRSEVVRKHELYVTINKLLRSPGAHREEIGKLWQQSLTGFDRMCLERNRQAMAKLQGK